MCLNLCIHAEISFLDSWPPFVFWLIFFYWSILFFWEFFRWRWLRQSVICFYFKMAWILYFDQAGYCFLIFTTSEMISGEVVGCLKFFGLRDLSFKPFGPNWFSFFCQLLTVYLFKPKCLAVKEIFLPWALCQFNIFNLCLARLVKLPARKAERAIGTAFGRTYPYIVVICLSAYLTLILFLIP